MWISLLGLSCTDLERKMIWFQKHIDQLVVHELAHGVWRALSDDPYDEVRENPEMWHAWRALNEASPTTWPTFIFGSITRPMPKSPTLGRVSASNRVIVSPNWLISTAFRSFDSCRSDGASSQSQPVNVSLLPHTLDRTTMPRLDGKTAIITGAGSGIGKAIARVLAEEGARLVLAGRRLAALDVTATEVKSLGAECLVVPTDVTDESQMLALFAQAKQFSPTLDLVINNAGTFEGGPIDGLDLATWQHVLAVNLTGPFLGTREAMRIMKPQGFGRIINIGSISAQMPRMHSAPYTTTKHGLVGLTKAAALEGRESGISVCCLHPGNVETERRAASDSAADKEPMMTPAEFAETVRTMAILPGHVTMLEAIVLPVTQAYVGRG